MEGAGGRCRGDTVASERSTVASAGDIITSADEAIAATGDTVASVGDAVASVGDTVASVGDAVASVGDTVASARRSNPPLREGGPLLTIVGVCPVEHETLASEGACARRIDGESGCHRDPWNICQAVGRVEHRLQARHHPHVVLGGIPPVGRALLPAGVAVVGADTWGDAPDQWAKHLIPCPGRGVDLALDGQHSDYAAAGTNAVPVDSVVDPPEHVSLRDEPFKMPCINVDGV